MGTLRGWGELQRGPSFGNVGRARRFRAAFSGQRACFQGSRAARPVELGSRRRPPRFPRPRERRVARPNIVEAQGNYERSAIGSAEPPGAAPGVRAGSISSETARGRALERGADPDRRALEPRRLSVPLASAGFVLAPREPRNAKVARRTSRSAAGISPPSSSHSSIRCVLCFAPLSSRPSPSSR
jgi:hypothetical protein